MIDYFKGLYGINLLLRVHGSSVYKGSILGLVSVCIYIAIVFTDVSGDHLNHPYAVGVLVSSVSFLIVFRANYGYQRYWEACGSVHHMMSKWLDATTHAGAYHLQCKHYDDIKPPSFFDHQELNYLGLTRDRERASSSSTSATLDPSVRSINKVHKRKTIKNLNAPQSPQPINTEATTTSATHLHGNARLDGGWNSQQQQTPSLFLQELSHLSSLMVAVAFSTLRNDIDNAPSPLDLYTPGQPWPEVDPKYLPKDQKNQIHGRYGSVFRHVKYWLGSDRTPKRRTKYNAARPMLVLGGVSDAEIEMLQRAKGSSAKTQLVWNWVSEFLIREQLAGSLGAVGPPIVSRCFQFLSDGMIYYNHARKVTFIPFPFPSAQISAFFTFVVVITVPLLMSQYANIAWLGSVLTFLTVTCLAGLHEAGREMENPFRNIPNDIPLCTLMAMYNESLVTMYYGYHPDSYWDASKYQQEDGDVLTETVAAEPKRKKNVVQPPQKLQQLKETLEFKQLKDKVSKQEHELQRLRELIENQLEIS